MTNSEINNIIDDQDFSIAYDEIHTAIHQLDYAAMTADVVKALSYLENAGMLITRAKIKIQNNQIYDSTRPN